MPVPHRISDSAISCHSGGTTRLLRGGSLPATAERLVVEFPERTVRTLSVCNVTCDNIDQVRRFERIAENAAPVLLVSGDLRSICPSHQ